ncbi:hypothetical protein [Spirosoma litoris]
MKTTLTLPEPTLSLNVLRKLSKHEYKALRDRYFYIFKGQPHCLHPGPVKLTLVRMSVGELDYDNLVGGAKPAIDALVNAGIIRGDKLKDIAERAYEQAKVKAGQQSTVFIIECL